jgi:suppressor of fused protein SUFU
MKPLEPREGGSMDEAEVYTLLRRHLEAFFIGHACEEHIWTVGPTWKVPSRFRVAEFAPGPMTNLWVYVSIGAWEGQSARKLEFLIAAPQQDILHVELLTMTAWYHREQKLGWGHTFPIGRAWLPGSSCDYMLLSLPYPFGEELEVCQLPEGHVQFLWLLPITRAEREFKIKEGLEALEQRFEERELEYWVPERASAV